MKTAIKVIFLAILYLLCFCAFGRETIVNDALVVKDTDPVVRFHDLTSGDDNFRLRADANAYVVQRNESGTWNSRYSINPNDFTFEDGVFIVNNPVEDGDFDHCFKGNMSIESGSNIGSLQIWHSSNDFAGPTLVGKKSRGTYASPTATNSSDPFLKIAIRGYTTAFQNPIEMIGLRANETWAGSSFGSRIDFYSVPNGTTGHVHTMKIYESKVQLVQETALRLLATDGSKDLTSVSDLTTWIAGTTNRVTVADDGDGTITLSGPQDLHTGASPTFSALDISSASADYGSFEIQISGSPRIQMGVYEAFTTYGSLHLGNITPSSTNYSFAGNGSFLNINCAAAGATLFTVDGTEVMRLSNSGMDLNGNELILDADADTSITADTDDQIDVKVGGTDQFKFLTGGTIEQNGTKHTVDSSAPGSPSDGDTWFDTIDEMLWVYDTSVNSGSWKSSQLFTATCAGPNGISSNLNQYVMPITTHAGTAYDILLQNWTVCAYVATTNDATNYWNLSLASRTDTNTNNNISVLNTQSNTVNNWVIESAALTNFYDVSSSSVRIFYLTYTKASSPGVLYASGRVEYRLVKP